MRDRPTPHSFERLIQAGIAPRRAHRILREFAEHHADVVAECLAAGDSASQAEDTANTRMGSQQQLVANLLGRAELRSWAHRRPGVAFALAPVLSLALAFVASLSALVAAGDWRKAHGEALRAGSPTIQWMSDYAGIYLLWALPLGAAALLAVVAARRRETSFWPCVGIAATCFVGALTNFSVVFPPTVDSPAMSAGIGFGTDNVGSVLLRAGSTTALVLLPYLRTRRLQRHELDALS